MKNILKIFAIFVIAIFPMTFVNAESRIESIVENILKDENFQEMHAKATYEDDNIHINWVAPSGSNTKEIGFSVSGNVIEYTPGEITNYEEATLETSHLMYASSILQAALVLNGYTEDQISEFSNVPNYEINGYEFVEMGEQQEYSDGEGSTIYVTPYSIKIDVSKANLNTSNGELPNAGTTVEAVVNALNSDDEFTTTEYEGILYYSAEVELLSDELTVYATSYDYDYYWVSYQCEDDILTYEVNIDEITDYDEAESAMSHYFMASYIMQKALELNGYSAEEYSDFMSSEENTLTYELNGIEIKELGEAKSYTSEDETSSSTITVAPVSIKIDLAKANLKKQADEEETHQVIYETLDGANQNYDQSKVNQLVFRFSIDYDKFLSEGKVFIDNKEVPKDKYSVSKGSTIITLNNEYTNTLSAGNHTIEASVSDGSVSTQFTITKTNNPKTGDNIIIYIVMLGLSIVGLVVSVIYTKKKRFN